MKGGTEWTNPSVGSGLAFLNPPLDAPYRRVSPSGGDEPDRERRAAALTRADDDRPDPASLTLGSSGFHTGASVDQHWLRQTAGGE